MEGYHSSVLLREVMEALDVKVGNWYLDSTLGDGGHTLEILKRGGKVLGIDADPQALDRSRRRLEEAGYREQSDFVLDQGNFRDIENLITKQTDLPADATHQALQAGIADHKFAGAIFDLGVSSLQLESPERGFSFSKMGPLDMRMDPNLAVRASNLISIGGRKELYELFNNLGEEKYAKVLANVIVSAREVKPIETTRDLAEIVERTLGRQGKIHPATKIFQALRIAVNDELKALEEGLEQVKNLIEKNGYIVIISFHSLEDRIVKDTFRKWQDLGLGKILTKKPIVPSEQEVYENSRSRSAKLRVFEII